MQEGAFWKDGIWKDGQKIVFSSTGAWSCITKIQILKLFLLENHVASGANLQTFHTLTLLAGSCTLADTQGWSQSCFQAGVRSLTRSSKMCSPAAPLQLYCGQWAFGANCIYAPDPAVHKINAGCWYGHLLSLVQDSHNFPLVYAVFTLCKCQFWLLVVFSSELQQTHTDLIMNCKLNNVRN